MTSRRNGAGILIAIAATAAIAWAGATLPDISDNERQASTLIKSLTSAEAAFRANDLDGNGVHDFWTADLSGLYSIRDLRLIPRELAEADGKPLSPLCPKPVPYHGYLFVSLEEDDDAEDPLDRPYRTDTGGTPPMGEVHHTGKFGFCAYPAVFGVTGRHVFIVNENNTVYRADIGGRPVTRWPRMPEKERMYGCTCPEDRRR